MRWLDGWTDGPEFTDRHLIDPLEVQVSAAPLTQTVKAKHRVVAKILVRKTR